MTDADRSQAFAVLAAPDERLDACASEAIEAADAELTHLDDAVRRRDAVAILRALDAAGCAIHDRGLGPLLVLSQLAAEAARRDAATGPLVRLRAWSEQVAFRPDVAAAARVLAEADLDEADARVRDDLVREVRLAGWDLPDANRERLRELSSRRIELETAFARNLREWDDHVDVDRAGLDGLPDAYVDALADGEVPGTKRVRLVDPEYHPFMERATRRDLRELLERKWRSRAVAENRPLIEQALAVRAETARLLGYPTWFARRTDGRMARTPAAVRAFLERVLAAVRPAAIAELAALTDALERDTGSRDLRSWDWRFYDDRRVREAGMDPDVVSAYLPLDVVLERAFDVIGSVVGVAIEEIEVPHPWAPCVRRYAVRDAGDGRPLGAFHADLGAREGKASGAWAWAIRLGDAAVPIEAILVASLPSATPARPALLRMDDVEAIFHELGHVLHMLLARTRWRDRAVSGLEWDFVEAPSQILEHWAWHPDVLTRISAHHVTGAPMPRELAERVAVGRLVDPGIRTLVLLVSRALADLDLHDTPEPPDLDAVERALSDYELLPHPEGTFRLASLGHLMGGYDAGFYAYIWARVIGDDLFGRFEREGVLDPGVGTAYRREILEPGGERDPAEMVRRFLGREPTLDAFLRLSGLVHRDG